MNANEPEKNRGRWKLFLIIAICALPLVLSYVTYYVIKPTARTNYGTLLDPRLYPTPDLGTASLKPYQGKWIMLQAGSGECPAACKKTLTNMRQLRLMQGKEMNRIERVMLVTDQRPVRAHLLATYHGTHFLRADARQVHAWLPAEPGGDYQDRLYLIDPLGNLIMRYDADADPNKIKKDLTKLLKASGIG